VGLAFSWLSTSDYARHLDRQIHDVHCSFVPGLTAEQAADNPCRVAMYSPYAAIFRDKYWGGVPIGLFAVGAFVFFAAYSIYLIVAGSSAPRRAYQFYAFAGMTPLFASVGMATITLLHLGHFCKTCVGIYGSSLALFIAGIAAYTVEMRFAARELADGPATKASSGVAKTIVGDVDQPPPKQPEAPRQRGSFFLIPGWLLALGTFAVTPALLYVSALPSYGAYISSCGKLEQPNDTANSLIHLPARTATQPATMFVDPLCPTCKAFHQRLATEGFLDKLDITLVLFPLDSECNWMLDRPVHPGACMVSKAILCSDHKEMQVLEWAYENQEDLLQAAKQAAGTANVSAMIATRFPGLEKCIESKETTQRLSKMLRFIIANHLQVSTPQMFLGETRLCDEDTDMGLAYTMRKLAPALATGDAK
jgi:hypothetical protein